MACAYCLCWRAKRQGECAQSRPTTRRFRVLDECDEMLNMGFVEDVEKILGAGSVPAAVQTLLFSATLPAWVKDITARFLRPDHRVIDLVGNQRMKVRATGTNSPQLGWHASYSCLGIGRA